MAKCCWYKVPPLVSNVDYRWWQDSPSQVYLVHDNAILWEGTPSIFAGSGGFRFWQKLVSGLSRYVSNYRGSSHADFSVPDTFQWVHSQHNSRGGGIYPAVFLRIPDYYWTYVLSSNLYTRFDVVSLNWAAGNWNSSIPAQVKTSSGVYSEWKLWASDLNNILTDIPVGQRPLVYTGMGNNKQSHNLNVPNVTLPSGAYLDDDIDIIVDYPAMDLEMHGQQTVISSQFFTQMFRYLRVDVHVTKPAIDAVSQWGFIANGQVGVFNVKRSVALAAEATSTPTAIVQTHTRNSQTYKQYLDGQYSNKEDLVIDLFINQKTVTVDFDDDDSEIQLSDFFHVLEVQDWSPPNGFEEVSVGN